MSKKIQKYFINEKRNLGFSEIDEKILLGLDSTQCKNEKRKYLSMIREQTNSAMNNKKYWNSF